MLTMMPSPPLGPRYGEEGWHNISVDGTETIESIIARLQPRDGVDCIPHDMHPFVSEPFELSLNDRTPLARNVTLADHEMVPGDLLYIINSTDAMGSSRKDEYTHEELLAMGAGASCAFPSAAFRPQSPVGLRVAHPSCRPLAGLCCATSRT